MIEKISLALISESGDVVHLEKETAARLEIKIDIATADLFSSICFRNNTIADAEIKTAEKFFFALKLKKYLEEINENANTTGN